MGRNRERGGKGKIAGAGGRRRIPAVLLLLFLLIMPGGGILRADGNDFSTAASLIEEGRFLEAAGVYRGIAADGKGDRIRSRALFFLGTTLNFYLDQPEGALGAFSRVMTEFPQTPAAADALMSRGIVNYEMGRYGKALAWFERYLKIYPAGMRARSAGDWIRNARQRLGKTGGGVAGGGDAIYLADSEIRVLLQRGTSRVLLGGENVVTVREAGSGRAVYSGKGPFSMGIKGGECVLAGKRLAGRVFSVSGAHGRITLGKGTFRGSLTVVKGKKGYLVVNHVPLEQYLYGVVPGEMSNAWEMEALMAQAVAARTYVVQLIGKNRGELWDLDASTKFQVYGGFDVETESTTRAVDSTRGRVMTHGGKPIIAYYHANSGGYTEDPVNVWGASLPYLKAVPDPWSERAPDSGWELYLSAREVETLFRGARRAGKNRKTAVTPLGMSPSGRVSEVLVYPAGGPRRFTGNDFRIRIGPTRLRSTLFHVEKEGRGFRFRGRGYGHGVGMSQWGAQFMALEGFDFREILMHYYRNIEFKRVVSR